MGRLGQYDYLVLSSDEFELFCKDILEMELNIKLENFKSGKDGGIDLRYAPAEGEKIIVQCKRYKDFKSLESTIKKEVEKVIKLNPDRYIFMTSVPLNPNDKDIIKSYFKGFIKSTGDILGKDELDTILKNHHSIERKHYKLWLASTNIISTILHNDVFNRSKFTEEQIKEKISLYVSNDSYFETLRHLEKSNVIILSGGPGVGKTTLADMIYLNFASQDYEFIEISEDVDEGEKLYNPEKKQLFYYDDFLGRNFLNQKLAKNEDRRIISFIRKVMRADNKIFIMTTREYILKQAQINHDLFDDKGLEFNKYIIDVEKYTNNVKAKILYNHLFFSNLPKDLIAHFVIKKSYLNIISHRNYNPRLISRMTRELDYREIKQEEYSRIFIQELEYPYFTWQHIYENQITDYSRWILLLLMVMGDKKVSLNLLEDNFNSLNIYLGRAYGNIAFRKGLKELEKTFISIDKDRELMIGFLNPSVVDFLIQYNNNSRENLMTLWETSLYIFPMLDIFSLSVVKGKIYIPSDLQESYHNIILDRFDEFKDCQYTDQKVTVISRLEKHIDFNKGKAKELLLATINSNSANLSFEYTNLLINLQSVLASSVDLSRTFISLIDNIEFYDECLNLLRLNEYYSEELQQVLNKEAKEQILENITVDIKDYLGDEYDYDDVLENMKKISGVFNISTEKSIEKINAKYQEILQEMQYEPDYDEGDLYDYETEPGREGDYVEDLFESLLYD